MRILITGAGGFIGGHLLRALLADGHRLVAALRDPRRVPVPSGVETVAVDFTRDHAPEDWLPRMHGIDAVINTVGIIRETHGQGFDALHRAAPVALFRACAEAGVRRVIQVSALGADDEAVSAYHRSKRAADRVLMALDLDWTVLRPSIVYGPGAGSELFFRALAALPLLALPGGGKQEIQPIHIDDLVRAVRVLLGPRGRPCRVIDAVGAKPVSLREWIAVYRRGLGLGPQRIIALPRWLTGPSVRAVGLLPGVPVDAGTLTMLERGNTAPLDGFETALDFRPRAYDGLIATATPPERWHARLFFLAPLLRVGIALLWIVTGLVSAFVYPPADSYAMLARLGIGSDLAPLALYGAAALDTLLGIALLIRVGVRRVALMQIAIIATYSILIAIALPEYWLHPFGPVTKNIPLIIATLIVIATDDRGPGPQMNASERK